jgi:hypothetical protein
MQLSFKIKNKKMKEKLNWTKCCFFLLIGIKSFGQASVPPQEFSKGTKERFICSRGVAREEKLIGSTTKKGVVFPSTMAEWAAYSGVSLVNQLKASTDYDNSLRSLFAFDNSYGPALFSNANITAVAMEMYNISISHNGTLSSGMLGLTTYLHAATYHDFFQTSVTIDAATATQYNNAVKSFANNSHLFDLTDDALMILDEYLILCDLPNLRNEVAVLGVLKKSIINLTVQDNWKTIVNNHLLMQKYVTAYNRMFFLMFRGIQPIDVKFETAVNSDPDFVKLMNDMAVDVELKANSTLSLLSNNSIGEMIRMLDSKVLKPKVEPYLASIVKSLPRLTPNWYSILKAINEGGNCAVYSLCENMVNIRKEVDNMLFPNTFLFDDGKLTVRTSLSFETVEPLYYASKQAQAQVFRFLETDLPVKNDPNENLNMVLYGTMSDYHDWQSILNGLDTNNGGMYIENGATFYTYQRTSAESTFSLEELFRHEYVHYLQGRYMVNGSWGSSPIYKNNRLVWFEEGMAEHFAGSTDSKGVTIRESQGNAIKNDGASDYMTVNQILSADYNNGFKFYRYGNMLWSYWFNKDMATARAMVRLVIDDNVAGYDSKISQLKADSNLQTAFTAYLNNVVIKESNWWSVNTPWIDDKLYTVGTPADIQSEFNAIAGVSGTGSTLASTVLRRFSVVGTLSGGNFDTTLNTIIEKLKKSTTVNNFKYLTGYYKQVSGSTANYVITGPLRNASISDNVMSEFSTLTKATISGGSIKFKNESTGYIKGYKWSFPGGTPSTSTLAEPEVVYNGVGKFNVSLEIIGKDGNSVSNTKTNYITIYLKSNSSYCDASVASDYTGITNVVFSNVNNISNTKGINGYSDFSGLLAEVFINKTYPIIISPEVTWPENNFNVWIDWNQDGDFLDFEENVYTQIGETPSSGIKVSSTAKLGVTRMRVRYSYGKTSASCGIDDYMGEVEDYSVLVKDNMLSINDFNRVDTETNFMMYPNPAVDMVKFSSINTNEVTVVYIYDTLGRLVDTTNEASLYSLKKFPKGIYFVRFVSGSKQETKKLIVK